jgi:hypothetical protein
VIWNGLRVEQRLDLTGLTSKGNSEDEIVTLVAAAMISLSPTFAQAKFQVAEVDQILTNRDQYDGQTVALHGVVGTAYLQDRKFTVIDFKSSTAGGPNVRFGRIIFPEQSRMTMPRPGQETIVIGQIVKKRTGTNLLATQVFTNRADIQQILAEGSIVRGSG